LPPATAGGIFLFPGAADRSIVGIVHFAPGSS
jgi:hypothetical protein